MANSRDIGKRTDRQPMRTSRESAGHLRAIPAHRLETWRADQPGLNENAKGPFHIEREPDGTFALWRSDNVHFGEFARLEDALAEMDQRYAEAMRLYHAGQSWMDLAVAQAKAAIKEMGQ